MYCALMGLVAKESMHDDTLLSTSQPLSSSSIFKIQDCGTPEKEKNVDDGWMAVTIGICPVAT